MTPTNNKNLGMLILTGGITAVAVLTLMFTVGSAVWANKETEVDCGRNRERVLRLEDKIDCMNVILGGMASDLAVIKSMLKEKEDG